MAFSEQDAKQSEEFLKLFCEAKWNDVTPEKAILIYRAVAWLQKLVEKMQIETRKEDE